MSQEHCEQFAEALTKPHYKKLSQQRFSAGYNNHISFLCICKGWGITFSTSAKEFIDFQERTLKSICILLLTVSKNTERILKELQVCGKLYENIWKLLFQRFCFRRCIINKILQTSKMSKKKKIIGGILGWCSCSSCLCTISNRRTSNGQNVPRIKEKNIKEM